MQTFDCVSRLPNYFELSLGHIAFSFVYHVGVIAPFLLYLDERRRLVAILSVIFFFKVVHCSAGVGRTGTFIVVDAMLQRIAAEKTVDVFGYVMSLRCDRNIMVQVEEQYVFIHEVLLEAIHSGYTEVRASDLRSHIKNLMQVNQNSGL